MADALKQVSQRDRLSVADVIRQSILQTLRSAGLLPDVRTRQSPNPQPTSRPIGRFFIDPRKEDQMSKPEKKEHTASRHPAKVTKRPPRKPLESDFGGKGNGSQAYRVALDNWLNR